ncbi:RNA-directed DNA polymerase (Reverse transcriptase), partial [Trifolium medium]|nr:RNA-directed DNA polymerase (Reverse transcriptase) [Trifolium medium]
ISVQAINPQKSTIFVGSISNARLQSIANSLGFSIGTLPFIYLGVPIFKGKPKAIYFQPLVDKIKTKLASWKASLLSYAGRVETEEDWHIFFDCEGSKEAWNVMGLEYVLQKWMQNRTSFVWTHSKISATHVGMKAIQAGEEWTIVQGIFDEQNQTIMQHNNRILQQPTVNPIAAHWTPPCPGKVS